MLYPNEPVIDNSKSWSDIQNPAYWHKGQVGTTCTGYEKSEVPIDESICASPDDFPASMIVDKSEWDDRINELERTGTRLSDQIIKAGLPDKDQARTNYCWVNSTVLSVEVRRMQQNEPYVELSPASVGAAITGFRNVGGMGTQALQYIATNGIVPASMWPCNAIDKRYDTDEAWQAARKFIVAKWQKLHPRDLTQMMSVLLRVTPSPAAFMGMGHEVCLIDALKLNGQYAVRARNPWGDAWGYKGFFVLGGSKILSDDIVVPLSTVAS